MLKNKIRTTGAKADNLEVLRKKGFNVPNFFVISYQEIGSINIYEIEEKIKEKISNDNKSYIIRSSANCEDDPENSFAGMFDSVVIRDKTNFKRELKRVLDSVRSVRLSEYLKTKNITEKPNLSLIIQEYIKGEVSGVMFTSTTKSGKKGTLINSNFGTASSIVQGKSSDYYFIDNKGDIIESIKQGKKDSLSNSQINKIFRLGKIIENNFKTPQDIEWTIKDNQIYLLQSRPITKNISEEIMVWDNSNIAESYSGIVLPLTCSYIKHAYKVTYIDLAKRSGISEEKIKESKDLFENLLGFFYGRVYYNMLNWYRMLTLYPGYKRNKKNLDIMISAKSKEEFDEDNKKNVTALFKIKYYFKLVLRYPFFNKEVNSFKKEVKDYLDDFNKLDLKTKTKKELLDTYNNSINSLLKKWGITVENDFLLMTYFGLLKKFCEKNNIEDQFTYLISNIKDVISAKQVDSLKELSEKFYEYNLLIKLAQKEEYKKCFEEINKNEDYKNLSEWINYYLIKYGGRFANDLKLETEDLDSNPEYIIRLLSLYKSIDLKDKPTGTKMIDKKFSFLNGLYLKHLIKKIKFYARQREELRLLRSQGFSIARKIFLEIGENFQKEDIIKDPKDIFYLNVEEIIENIQENKSKNFIEIIKNRKKEYGKYSKVELEDVFYTYGNSIESRFTKIDNKHDGFKGQGCSPGIITGKVKVMNKFSLPDKGKYDIVVTKHTDPGWTPLFGLCNGLIVEHGGLLSHAAIISRELNLPCIIGLRDATKKLKDGQTITLNGYNGEVNIHD